MKPWDAYTTDEKLMALVHEIHNLKNRCDEQAEMIGVQGRWIEQLANSITQLCGTLANHKEHFEQMNINCLAINNVLLQNEVMEIEQYRREFSRAAFVHDQFTAAIRDGKNPMEKQDGHE